MKDFSFLSKKQLFSSRMGQGKIETLVVSTLVGALLVGGLVSWYQFITRQRSALQSLRVQLELQEQVGRLQARLLNTTTSTTLSPATVSEFDFTLPNEPFSVSKKTFIVRDEYSPKLLAFLSQGCNTGKDESYFQKVLSHFSASDRGVDYQFKNAKGEWWVRVLPNKVGYGSLVNFQKDFNVCAAGGAVPSMATRKQLLFSFDCSGAVGDEERVGVCEIIKQEIFPTIKLK